MDSTEPYQKRYAALQSRNFTLIWSGLMVSNVGTRMQNVAEGLGGVQGAPRAVLLGAVLLAFTLIIIMPIFWKRDLPDR